MKKRMLFHCVATLLMTSQSAPVLATSGNFYFMGSVGMRTCNVVVQHNGAITTLIQLGRAPLGGIASPVDFELIADPTNPGAGCGYPELDAMLSIVTWSGPFNENGLMASGGQARDAIMTLETLNAVNGVWFWNTRLTTQLEFRADALFVGPAGTPEGKGMRFRATLKGGTLAGDYQSVAVYNMLYY